MKHIFPVLALLLLLSDPATAQSFELVVRDNLAKMNMEQVSRLTTDSLVVTAVSDQGRSKVNYLNRALTEKERKAVLSFLKTYPMDSLQAVYFMDYSNYTVIDEEHYPRSIELSIAYNGRSVGSKATNAWVGYYDRLFQMMNQLLPREAGIVLDKSKFNVFY